MRHTWSARDLRLQLLPARGTPSSGNTTRGAQSSIDRPHRWEASLRPGWKYWLRARAVSRISQRRAKDPCQPPSGVSGRAPGYLPCPPSYQLGQYWARHYSLSSILCPSHPGQGAQPLSLTPGPFPLCAAVKQVFFMVGQEEPSSNFSSYVFNIYLVCFRKTIL